MNILDELREWLYNHPEGFLILNFLIGLGFVSLYFILLLFGVFQ